MQIWNKNGPYTQNIWNEKTTLHQTFPFHLQTPWLQSNNTLQHTKILSKPGFFPGLFFYVYIESPNPKKNPEGPTQPKPHQLKTQPKKHNPRPQPQNPMMSKNERKA